MRSIKTRLLVLTLTAVAVAWAIAVFLVYVDARGEIDELLDAHLAQAGALLTAQVVHELDEIEDEHIPVHKYSRQVVFQVWENGRVLRLHSSNAPDTPLGTSTPGFSDRIVNDTHWRVYSEWDDAHRYLVHVGERRVARNDVAREIAEHLLRPLFYTLPLLALFLWIAVSRGFVPLARLTHEVAQRDPDNLAPLDAARAPAEVAPFITQLNLLFERINALIENERRFTADAAHELRTPIAAIKAQAQVALQASESSEKNRALDNVVRGCDQAAHLVEQLLTLARLDRVDRGPMQACELRAIAASVIADLAPTAYGNGVTLALIEGDEVEVDAIPGLLYVLLRNLVDNAARYSPSGTTVNVSIARDDGHSVVVVTDEGPGIPPERHEAMFQRFHRELGTGRSGTGLGLSIVKRIADMHGATLAFDSVTGDRGLRVTVRF